MKTSENIVLGIDVGGSHVTLALVDVHERKLINDSYFRAHINSWGDAGDIIDAWAKAIIDIHQKAGIPVGRIGMAMPGPFDYENGVSYIRGNNKYDALYGLNIKQLLADKLSIEPSLIRMLNDAAGFLQGEVFCGAAKDYETAIGITLGTGLGTAYCTDGSATDAELWNSPFKHSIAEEYISTRWFVKRYFELSGLNIQDVKALAAIIKRSVVAKKVFAEFAENLALFIEQFLNNNKADVVIIGGNIAKASNLFLPALNRILASNNVNVPVKITALGEDAAIVGAASCWSDNHVVA